MRRALALAVLLAAPGIGHGLAQTTPADAAPQGEPRSDAVLRDPEFGVATRQFGLERRVEMYQWRRADGGYAKAWSAEAVDSAGFAPGYENPPFPLRSQRWIAHGVTLDGHALDPATLEAVGAWRTFRPNFSRLPGNLLATFQPEGDGLGTADNPLAPEIGDLRIGWRELVLPPLQGRVVLREGRWVPVPGALAAGEANDPAATATGTGLRWLLTATALLALAALALWGWRRRRRGG